MSSKKSSQSETTESDSDSAANQVDRKPGPGLVCLGASAGGLEALETFFEHLPPDTDNVFIVVVHLSPDFKSALPELLARKTRMPVNAAVHGEQLRANCVYIIPPRANMIVLDNRVELSEQDRGHGVNLPIDIFLKSLSEQAAERSVAIILSGTGSDGTHGCRLLKESGGLVFVQDPETAKFDGMPQSVLATGIADAVDAPERLARRLATVAQSSGVVAVESDDPQLDSDISEIIEIIKSKHAPDLRNYRRSMVARRIQRRMTLLGLTEIGEYVALLRDDADECGNLRRDMMIGVTSFFRDTVPFETLRKHFMTTYISRSDPKEQIRIWVPACSTGQEVYSIAMLCAELNSAGHQRDFKIFATDVHRAALDIASTGTYSMSEVAGIPPSMLARYFTVQDHYQVSRALREMVIFARHDIVKDPPFTRMDLISCRNFLIYLENQAQEQVLASCHFSLKMGGLLFLGDSETVGALEPVFDTVSSEMKLFRKSTHGPHPAMRRRSGLIDPIAVIPRTRGPREPIPRQDDTARQVLDATLDAENVACALLDTQGSIREIFSDPSGLFRLARGKPSDDITKAVPKEISVALTTGLHRIRKGERHVKYSTTVEQNAQATFAGIHLHLIEKEPVEESAVVLLIRLHDHIVAPESTERFELDSAEAERVQVLESELRHSKETLQATIEELQTTNEEQQSTNQELIAANEELQSTNEELQSVNEELHTVNVELQRKNEDLSVMTADLDNILQNIDVGTLFLDQRLRVRRFTNPVTQIVSLTAQDIGRGIAEFTHGLTADFISDIGEVVATSRRIDRQVSAHGGAWYHMSIVPYQTKLGAEEGVLVTFVDVTGTKNMEELTRSINAQLENVNQRLRNQTAELEDLFSITSHDLKRPITAMDGLLKLAQKQFESGNTQEASERLAMAVNECDRMTRMIHDLGHVSGIRAHDEVVEELDLQSWMDGIVSDFRERSAEKGIQLNYSSDRGIIYIPRTAPEQALRNIIENAILYGSGADQPRIDISCALHRGTLRLSVTDNGKGIAPEHQDRVFELFRRLEPDVGEGSGVGLVAARRLIKKAGGTVTLESSPGQGAKFSIELPIDTKAHPRDEKRLPRVLLVEDDSVDAKSAMRHLHDRYDVSWSTTLEDARELFESQSFDVILLDLSLPDGHGLELMTQVRKTLRKDIPIVILTGHSGIVEERALRASADGYLTKEAAQQQSILLSALGNALASRIESGHTADESQTRH